MPNVQTMTDIGLSVAANDVSANIYAGKLAEYLPGPSVVRIRARGSAVGLRFTLIINGETKVQDQQLVAFGASGALVLPDHLVGEYPAPEGGRLFAFFRNTTVGALTVDQVTEVITP